MADDEYSIRDLLVNESENIPVIQDWLDTANVSTPFSTEEAQKLIQSEGMHFSDFDVDSALMQSGYGVNDVYVGDRLVGQVWEKFPPGVIF